MAFRPCVAPIKVGVFRLINHLPFDPVVTRLRSMLQEADITNKVDSSSGTVGRRYSRADELGVPFGVTIDFQTLLDKTVTLRERDSMAQIRVPIDGPLGLVILLKKLVNETVSWPEVMGKYPVVSEGNSEEDNANAKEATSNTTSSVVVHKTSRGCFSVPNPSYVGSN